MLVLWTVVIDSLEDEPGSFQAVCSQQSNYRKRSRLEFIVMIEGQIFSDTPTTLNLKVLI